MVLFTILVQCLMIGTIWCATIATTNSTTPTNATIAKNTTSTPPPHTTRHSNDALIYKQRINGELRRSCSKYGTPKQPANRVDTRDKLRRLRDTMRDELQLLDRPIDAYIITSDDEHQTEYVAPYDRRREYISGFSGSSGDAIVTANKAALWTDGRYHLQADIQLSCDWLLMREGQTGVLSKAMWLKQQLPKNSRVGADPRYISASVWNSLEFELRNSSLQLVPLKNNLIDLIWDDHKDTIKEKDAFVWEMKYAGRNWTDKVIDLRNELKLIGIDAMVVTSLAEIAWLLNIRGRDIPYNPFVRSYLIVSMNEIRMYVDKSKLVKNNVNYHLHTDWGVNAYSVIIQEYNVIWTELRTLCQAWRHVLVPSVSEYSKGASRGVYALVPDQKRVYKPSPIILMKARKNPVEILGMENAHIRDAAAMCEFLEYFETRFKEGDPFNEVSVAQIIDDIRYEQNLSLGNSFETIVAFGANGALPHYEPTLETNAQIFDNSTIVVDSGGQYYDGTTDVTRTLHFGTPSPAQINAYTRVLMGNIQLSALNFPSNLRMSVADVMARAPLWEVGLDYMHGTGHGIGSFLGVHEPPIALHYNTHGRQQHFKAGYFLSNEPGYYAEGEFGIRLENILEVIHKPWLKQGFLGFKDVTLVPYEPKLMNLDLLGTQHRRWLNEYNTRIRQLVGKELKERNKMSAFHWMMDKTGYIPGKASKNTLSVLFVFTAALLHLILR